MNRILVDTSAWVEYLEGSEEGAVVKKYVENKPSPFTSIITIAELSDVYHRGGVKTSLRWGDIKDFIQFNSTIVGLNIGMMSKAGALKLKKRREMGGFGLVDAIILQCSIDIGAKLLTGDSHLLGEENTIRLKCPGG